MTTPGELTAIGIGAGVRGSPTGDPGPGGPRLMGSREIGERLGLSRQRVQQLAGRDDFPEPYQQLSMGRIWREPDVEQWISRHRV